MDQQTHAIHASSTGRLPTRVVDQAPRHGLHLDFRHHAIHADESSLTYMPLAPIWSELLSGELRIEACFSNDERHYATFATCCSPRARPRGAAFLERILLGARQKVMAFDEHLALPTLSTDLGDCLVSLGVDRRTSRVPLFLALLAQASHEQSGLVVGRASRFHEYLVLSISRPDAMFMRLLSPAEGAVGRLLIDGYTHAEIAAMRSVSCRTVANQLGSAFRKLGVSCRFELICYLLRHSDQDAASRDFF